MFILKSYQGRYWKKFIKLLYKRFSGFLFEKFIMTDLI